ncbi:MAG: chorismate mutase [Prolixibacteraceae bacterium]|nr:chorismate mutase [Prolixibacteraceae bacterium]
MQKIKNACDCGSLEEVRKQIDIIDHKLITLFAKRYEFVKEVVKYKDKTEDAIVAQERKDHVIEQRSEWAAKMGLDKEAYAKIFAELIDHNISKELEIIKNTTT